MWLTIQCHFSSLIFSTLSGTKTWWLVVFLFTNLRQWNLSKTEVDLCEVLSFSTSSPVWPLCQYFCLPDREAFASLVREVASPDVGRMGIEILSFTIKDIVDPVNYLDSLGKTQTAKVKRDADIGVAEANRDAWIRVRFTTKLVLSRLLEIPQPPENLLILSLPTPWKYIDIGPPTPQNLSIPLCWGVDSFWNYTIPIDG